VRIGGATYYIPQYGVSWGSLRVYYILWGVDSTGAMIQTPPSQYTISGSVRKNSMYMPLIKEISPVSAGEDGFFSGSVGISWDVGSPSVEPEKMLVLQFQGDENTLTLPPKRLPYPMGAWAQVYLDACKLGVLTMADQYEPLDVVVNSIVDTIRNGLQVVPGQSQSFYSQTAPASGGSWGDPVSFGFECVGFKVYNYGTVPVFFSLDGLNTHGFIPAGSVSWYDFRRTSQIYFQAATSDPQLFVEAW
jgi:hypothetical protein